MPYKDPEVQNAKVNSYYRERYRDNQAWVQAYKLQHGCTDCGWNAHHAGLEFDHVEPRLRGTVGRQMGKSLKVIQEEIARCEVVCATCHAIRTWERGWNAPNNGWRLPD